MNDSIATSHPLPGEPSARGRIAAISSTGQRRPIVIVLGMHRSGTSLCAHVLSAMGIDMADEIRPAASNARGHWERWEIVEFHDRILRLLNRDYYGPFHDFSLPVAWWADPRISQIKREIMAFLERRMGAGWFGFKDPRTVRLMPLWHQIFNDLRLAPKIVLCLRNPAQVARSLGRRDNLDPPLGEYRWLIYMIDFFRYCGRFEVCMIDYEGWFRHPGANFEKLKKLVDVEWQQGRPDLDLVLSGIVDPALRHDESQYNEPRQPLVGSLYRLAGDCDQDGGVRDEVNSIVAQFISFENLHAPLHQALENQVAIAAKYPGLEQQASALRAKIEQHAASEAALWAEIEQREAMLRAEIEQRAASEAMLRAEIEQLVATAAMLRAEIEQRAASEAALRSALDKAEREVQDWQARAEAVEADIAAMRRELANANCGLNEHAAAAKAFQTELEVMRTTLDVAERDSREHADAAEALRGEMASLRSELAVARDVGSAALASLRTLPALPAPMLEAPRKAGRLSFALRRLGFRSGYPLAVSPVIVDGQSIYS